MLQRILSSTSTHENAYIRCFVSLLETPMGTPTVPQRGKNSSVHVRDRNFGQVRKLSSNKRTIIAGQTREAVRQISPSLPLAPDSFNSVRSFVDFNGLQSCHLKLALNFGGLIVIAGLSLWSSSCYWSSLAAARKGQHTCQTS